MPQLIHAAPYGSCAYSEASFSNTGGCDGELTDTGQNWQYLVFAAIGLTIGVSLAIVALVLLRKRSRARSAQV